MGKQPSSLSRGRPPAPYSSVKARGPKHLPTLLLDGPKNRIGQYTLYGSQVYTACDPTNASGYLKIGNSRRLGVAGPRNRRWNAG